MLSDNALSESWVSRLAAGHGVPYLDVLAPAGPEPRSPLDPAATRRLDALTGGDPTGLLLLTVAAARLALAALHEESRHLILVPAPAGGPGPGPSAVESRPGAPAPGRELALCAPLDRAAPAAVFLAGLHAEFEAAVPLAWWDRRAIAERLQLAGVPAGRALARLGVTCAEAGGTLAGPVDLCLTLSRDAGALVLTATAGPTSVAGTGGDAAPVDGGALPAAAGALVRCTAAVLAALAVDPRQPPRDLDVLGPAQRAELRQWSGLPVAASYPEATLVGIVAAAAARFPRNEAVNDGAVLWSHEELAARSERAARALALEHGVKPGDRVALLLPRGPELVLCVLAVLRAGASFVPLDPSHPPVRLARQLRLSRAVCVVAEREELPERVPIPVVTPHALATGTGTGAGDRATAPEPDDEAILFFTSGSTGLPRPVALTHRQLAHKVVTSGRMVGFDEEIRCALLSAISSDALTYQIFTTLAAGGCVVPVGSPQLLSPAEFWSVKRRLRINVVNCVPSLLAVMAEGLRPGAAEEIRICLLGGDEIPAGLLPRLADRLKVGTFANLYGPTEATIEATTFLAPGSAFAELTTVPVGRPSPGFAVAVLTPDGDLAPAGIPGEIYVLGPGVATGYLDEEPSGPGRFVELPGHPDVRAFRTGDFGRWSERGELTFLGRRDNQLQIHGNRVELGEVEAALSAVPGLRAATVLPLTAGSGPPQLVAAYTADGSLQPSDVRDRLVLELPGYMVPGRILRLDDLPVTLHGKVDRRAVLARLAGLAEQAWEPLDEDGRMVAQIWAEVLGAPPRAGDEDLFAAGGHSLTAAVLAQRLCAAFGSRAVTVRTVFAAPTPDGLLAQVRQRAAAEPAAPVPWPAAPAPVPASNAQRRMWFLEDYEEGEVRPYNMVEAFRLPGAYAAEQVEAALARTVERHQALRTVYRNSPDGLEQVVLPASTGAPELWVHRPAPGEEGELLSRLAAEEQRHRFDLARGPLVRAHWIDGVLLFSIHHSVCDGWSFAVILRDLQRFLDGQPPLPEPTQYGAYALDRFTRGPSGDDLAFWRAALDAASTVELPLDRPRPARRDSAAGSIRLTLPDATAASVLQLCRELGTTSFTVLVAAVRVLLLRWAGEPDVVLGTVVSGRDEPGLADSVGLFVNTVALRTAVDPERGFTELVTAVRDHASRVRAHAEYPFESLVDQLGVERVTGRNPLFDVLVEASVSGLDPLGSPSGPQAAHLPMEAGANAFDLVFSFTEPSGGHGLELTVTYREDVLERATAQRLAGQLEHQLAVLLDDPARPVGGIPLLPAGQRAELIAAGTGPAGPDLDAAGILPDLVRDQIRRTPYAPSVVCGERTLTYTDLDREADALAARLAAVASVGPGRVVAVLVERDEWMPVAVLAVLRTGSAFLPLDPDQSAARLSAVLRDSQAVAALTSARFAAVATAERLPVVPVGGPAGVRPVPAGAAYPRAGREDLAFVVYTSGSTGTPKGVMIRHAGVVNSIVFRIGYYGLGPGRAHLQVDPIHTDAGIDDLFSALCSGATTVIVTREQLLTPAEVATALRRYDVRHVTLVPSLYQMLLDEVGSAFAGVRQIVLGGERVTRALVVRHRQFLPRAALFNEYGPAEDSCVTTVDEVVLPSGTLCGDATIGRPLPGKWVDLVDEKGELVPWGAAGELCIGGAGLARGYLGDPELTDARFVPSRVRPGERNYRTGDLARWLPDGRLEYLGRGDDQLKIRGNRVEPNEVGAVLARAPGLRNAAVVPIAGPDGAPRLIAYVAGETPTAVLRRYLAQRLPAYMMPEAFVHLATLPVAQSGKLDRRALPPPVEEPDDGEVPVRPFTAAERRVADVWTEALGRPVADPDANLFDLGGHSLTAARIAHALGVRVHAVFTHQTVSALAAACADNPAPAGERKPGDEGGETGPGFLPLSRAQRRVWLTSRRSGTDTFLVSNVVRPGRHLEPEALRRALEAVVERQDMLRAYARPRGWEAELAVEQRLPDGVPLVVVPLPGVDPAGPQVTEALHDARRVTFPLDVAPLFEVRLLHGVAGGDLLTVTAHHLIYDGASVDVLLTDLFTAYDRIVTGAEPGLAPLELSYQEWIRQEQRWLAGPEAERQLAYWRDRLAGVEPGPDPVDPGRRGSRRGRTGMVGVVVPAEPLAGVPATPFAQVVTAFAETVHRRTGATDLVIGFAAGLRDRPETDALIGYLVNALALRIAVDDAGPRELLPRVQDGIVEAYEHSRLPFDLLAERLRLRARPGRSVLLDLGVSWENASLAGEFEAVEDLLPDDLPATSDMWLYARVRPDGLHLDLTYDDHLLTPAEAASYLDEVAGVLRGLGSAADSVGSDTL